MKSKNLSVLPPAPDERLVLKVNRDVTQPSNTPVAPRDPLLIGSREALSLEAAERQIEAFFSLK